MTTCTPFTGRGAGGPSIDQAIAAKIGRDSRFSSIQIGVSQESFGESIQRNMSWAGYDRPLPPQMLPNKLFDFLFGVHDEGWVARKRSILDAVREEALALEREVPKDDRVRLDEHLSAIRDLERAIAGLPPEYRKIDPPDYDGDMKDWPRIAKLQSDLLAQALATRQTRVAQEPALTGSCYHPHMPNRTEPKTPLQWIRYVVVAVIALFLVWWMLRVYVL